VKTKMRVRDAATGRVIDVDEDEWEEFCGRRPDPRGRGGTMTWPIRRAARWSSWERARPTLSTTCAAPAIRRSGGRWGSACWEWDEGRRLFVPRHGGCRREGDRFTSKFF
jgi:hypothetical protein